MGDELNFEDGDENDSLFSFEGDDEDSNAEDYYGNDYPDEITDEEDSFKDKNDHNESGSSAMWDSDDCSFNSDYEINQTSYRMRQSQKFSKDISNSTIPMRSSPFSMDTNESGAVSTSRQLSDVQLPPVSSYEPKIKKVHWNQIKEDDYLIQKEKTAFNPYRSRKKAIDFLLDQSDSDEDVDDVAAFFR